MINIIELLYVFAINKFRHWIQLFNIDKVHFDP